MYKPNKKHYQVNVFGFQEFLSEQLKQQLFQSPEYYFYNIIFCNINEDDFSVLYSDKVSRPNSPINCLVGSFLLRYKNNWTYEELFNRVHFDILTKTALGLNTLDEIPFDESTFFNFQNRIIRYEIETGINLIAQVFDRLTKEQIKNLKLKTDIQRSDSFMASSNIRSYSRLQLLIEILLRLWRVMDDEDKEKFKSEFAAYIGKSSGQNIYKLKSEELPSKLDEIAQVYHFCKINIIPKYQDSDICQSFERVYTEHFTVVEEKIQVKPSEELHSSCLQSPDDLDATYREKRKEQYQGQSINIVETASPENPLNLITDIAVSPNNIDDSVVLNERIDTILEKTPDLKELHTDGSYGSTDNDKKFEESGIMHVQTAVRGRQGQVPIEIEQQATGEYQVSCPLQSVTAEGTKKRYKSLFNKSICQECPFKEKCPSIETKNSLTYYFTQEDYLRNKRQRNLLEIPEDRRKIRPNVEATVNEFTCRMTNHKLRVRGAVKTELFAYASAIGINFGRIFRYMHKKPVKTAFIFFNFVQIVKEQINYFKKLRNIYFLVKISSNFFNLINNSLFYAHSKKLCF